MKQKVAELQTQLESDHATIQRVENHAISDIANATATQAQLKTDLRAARGQKVSPESELQVVAHETQINDLQAQVSFLQMQLRKSQMEQQDLQMQLARVKDSVQPTTEQLRRAHSPDPNPKLFKLSFNKHQNSATVSSMSVAFMVIKTKDPMGQRAPVDLGPATGLLSATRSA